MITTDLSDLLAGSDVPLVGLEDLEDLLDGLLGTSSQVHWVASSSHVLDTLGVDGPGKDSGGGSTVTSSVVGLRSDILNESGDDVSAKCRRKWHLVTHLAPRFSTGSFNVMALATDTPSLVIFGPPKLWPRRKRVSNDCRGFATIQQTFHPPMMTVRPFGPRVAETALARMSTPRSMPCLASLPKTTSLAYPRFETAETDWTSLAGRGRAARDRAMFIIVLLWCGF